MDYFYIDLFRAEAHLAKLVPGAVIKDKFCFMHPEVLIRIPGFFIGFLVLRKLLKVLLLPVAFVLFFIRWALEASVKLTEWAVGLLTLIVGAAIIYSIVIHRWGDLFLYSLIFAGILAILMAVVVVQDFCSSMLEKISML